MSDKKNNKDIPEPYCVVTERMLLLHDPQLAEDMGITETKEEAYEYLNLKTRDKNGDTTFTSTLLVHMYNAGKFPALNIKEILGDPKNMKHDVPEIVLQRRNEAFEAEKQIRDSLVNTDHMLGNNNNNE